MRLVALSSPLNLWGCELFRLMSCRCYTWSPSSAIAHALQCKWTNGIFNGTARKYAAQFEGFDTVFDPEPPTPCCVVSTEVK